MIGLDLLEVGRLERALARRPALGQRLFTAGERELAGGDPQRLAARFCAKEAVAKALRLEKWSWQDVEVLSSGGPPELRLHGAAAEQARRLAVRVEVSLTHERGHAAAVALAVPA